MGSGEDGSGWRMESASSLLLGGIKTRGAIRSRKESRILLRADEGRHCRGQVQSEKRVLDHGTEMEARASVLPPWSPI